MNQSIAFAMAYPIHIIDKYANELQFWNESIQEPMLYEILSIAHENIGNYKYALDCQRKADSLKNEVMPPVKIRELEKHSTEIYIAEKNREIDRSIRKFDKSLKINTLLGIITSIAVIACSFAFFRLRNKKRHILRLSEELKELERIYSNLEKDSSANLELRNQEISSIAIQLANVRENIESLKKIAANPKIKKTEIVEAVEATVRQISLEEKVIDPVVTSFEKVNQSLFDRLYKLHPNLTKAEIRMCGYILMNRTNKEIATIIHRSVRTV